ncbi:MAG: hypothetical protein QM606_04295, partial [Leucobacter sp.]
PGGGPLAAVAVALPEIAAEWTMLLPCDLVHPAEVCEALRRALRDVAADPAPPLRIGDGDGRFTDSETTISVPDSAGTGSDVERGAESGSGATAGAQWDGALLRDESGRPQWLAGVYSTAMLRRGVAALGGELSGRPLRALFDGARLREIEVRGGIAADIDTPDDLARAAAET